MHSDKGPESRSFPAAGAYKPGNIVRSQRGKEGGGLGCSAVTAPQRFEVSLLFAVTHLSLCLLCFSLLFPVKLQKDALKYFLSKNISLIYEVKKKIT